MTSARICNGLVARNISVRLRREEQVWVERLARRNDTPLSAMVRALISGLRIAVEEGRIDRLDMGELSLKP
jgi:hypothetical protein